MTPYDRLDKAIEEHALARGAWTTVAQGREIACLAATLDPEVGRQRRAAACDAKIMPAWFAELTVRIDDKGTDDRTNPDGIYWTTMRRYARTIRRAAILTPADWKRCLHRCNAVSVREARSHVPAGEAKTLAAIDGVLVLLDRACSGGTVTDDEWSAAWAAAPHGVEGRRQWARLRLREAWRLWFDAPW